MGYDANNRVTFSSAHETWAYDAVGNTTAQTNRDGSRVATTYDAQNRATLTVNTAGETATTSVNTFDEVGNILNTHVSGDGFRYDEVTRRDLRYLERNKDIANSYAKGLERLEGSTRFDYDANGNLTFIDRGRKKDAAKNSAAYFEYDLESQIIGRADKASAEVDANLFEGSAIDPATTESVDLWGRVTSRFADLQAAYAGPGTQLQSYLFANNKPLGQAQSTQTVSVRRLALNGGVQTLDTEGTVTAWNLTLTAQDFPTPGALGVERTAIARQIATIHYPGFLDLSANAQAKVVAYVLAQLPADAHAGSVLALHGYIVLAESKLDGVSQITDYSIRQIGADGLPAGNVQTHVIRAGESLQSVAQMYFGSASYWYLIADANGLQGTEPLAEGTTLTIPNAAQAGNLNSAETFKVYNESKVIGSTSPEIRTVAKRLKWWQKLIQIVIIVMMFVAAYAASVVAKAAYIVVAYYTGNEALAALAAVGAGASVMAMASIETQGVAVAAGLQEEFSWKQVGKAAVQGAFIGAAAAATMYFGGEGGDAAASEVVGAAEGAETVSVAAQGASAGTQATNWAYVGTQVGIEATRQFATDGKITSWAGLAGAAIGAGALNGLSSSGGFTG